MEIAHRQWQRTQPSRSRNCNQRRNACAAGNGSVLATIKDVQWQKWVRPKGAASTEAQWSRKEHDRGHHTKGELKSRVEELISVDEQIRNPAAHRLLKSTGLRFVIMPSSTIEAMSAERTLAAFSPVIST